MAHSFAGFTTGDWVVITKSRDNWAYSMDQYVGKVCQLGEKAGSLAGFKIELDKGMYEWNPVDKHFRKAEPHEIPKSSNKTEVFPGIYVGDIVVSLDNPNEVRDIGTIHEVLERSSKNDLWYDLSTGYHSNAASGWRKATTDEEKAYRRGVRHIRDINASTQFKLNTWYIADRDSCFSTSYQGIPCQWLHEKTFQIYKKDRSKECTQVLNSLDKGIRLATEKEVEDYFNIVNRHGMHEGMVIPKEILNDWIAAGQNWNYQRDRKGWCVGYDKYMSDRKVSRFKVVDGHTGFGDDGSDSQLWLKCEGFMNFMNKAPSRKMLVHGKYHVGDVVVSTIDMGSARKIGQMLEVMNGSTESNLKYSTSHSSDTPSSFRAATPNETKHFRRGVVNINGISEFGISVGTVYTEEEISMWNRSGINYSSVSGGFVSSTVAMAFGKVVGFCDRSDGVVAVLFENYPSNHIRAEGLSDFVSKVRRQKEKAVYDVNTWGLKVGMHLPEKVIREWARVGGIKYDDYAWENKVATYNGDRTIDSFKTIDGIDAFKVSGSGTHLKCEGFSEFLRQTTVVDTSDSIKNTTPVKNAPDDFPEGVLITKPEKMKSTLVAAHDAPVLVKSLSKKQNKILIS